MALSAGCAEKLILPSAPSLAIDAAMSFAPQSLNARLQAAQGYLGLGMASGDRWLRPFGECDPLVARGITEASWLPHPY